jgi:hypothetical protein
VAGRRSPVTDIREILRRLHLGEPDRRIARDLNVSRNTVAHYRLWASRHGVLRDGQIPEAATLAALLERAPPERPPHEQSLVEPLRERVLALHARSVEGQALRQLLVEEHGFTGSYSSVKRFLRRVAPTLAQATLRIEVDPRRALRRGHGAELPRRAHQEAAHRSPHPRRQWRRTEIIDMEEVRSRHHTGWATLGGSPWATVDTVRPCLVCDRPRVAQHPGDRLHSHCKQVRGDRRSVERGGYAGGQ